MKQPTRTQLLKKSLLFVLPFQVVAILIGIIAALSGATGMTLGLLIVITVTLWAPSMLTWMTRVPIPFALQVNYFIFIILSSLAGSGLGAYAWIPNWDTYVHAYSGLFLAWLGFFAIQQAEVAMKATAPKWLTIIMGITTALAFAALWEMGEYWSDNTLGTSTQAGLSDTIIDMVAALIGATIAVILTWAKLPASVLSRAFVGKK